MALSILRFVANDWIDAQFIQPTFHFSFIPNLPVPNALGMYILFAILFFAAVGVMLGLAYRVSIVSFFLIFTYIELIDKTYYLNHYYFVSIIAFLLIWLPAHRSFSFDVWLKRVQPVTHVPGITIHIILAHLVLVYFYAGVAKLNHDWLFHALPLKIWLPNVSHLPIVGPLLKQEATAYVMSLAGMFFDISIGFFLLFRATRVWAYITVVIFHAFTAFLFPIGMFPWIMIGCTTIFFSANWHLKIQSGWRRFWNFNRPLTKSKTLYYKKPKLRLLVYGLSFFFILQCILPWRFMLYPGDLFWTERGYRFSWRVMLMEKGGHTFFTVKSNRNELTEIVDNSKYLTPLQEKMMSTQPDMIIQFAHFLADEYDKRGFDQPQVYATSKVSLNGAISRTFVKPKVDLAQQSLFFNYDKWLTE